MYFQFLEFCLPFSFVTFSFDNRTPQSQNQLVIREYGSFTVVDKVGIWIQNQLVIREYGSFTVVDKVGIWIIWLGLVWYLSVTG